MGSEPVSVVSAITSAITSTVAILLFFGVDPKLVGAISVAATAWVGVGAAIVRSKVIPKSNLAPAAILAAGHTLRPGQPAVNQPKGA
jgi:hypothetical protein